MKPTLKSLGLEIDRLNEELVKARDFGNSAHKVVEDLRSVLEAKLAKVEELEKENAGLLLAVRGFPAMPAEFSDLDRSALLAEMDRFGVVVQENRGRGQGFVGGFAYIREDGKPYAVLCSGGIGCVPMLVGLMKHVPLP